MNKKATVLKLPTCDFCGGTAHYDGKTIYGAWGNMCLQCFGERGIGLGLGRGQELVLKEDINEGNQKWK